MTLNYKMDDLVLLAINASLRAGKAILNHYKSSYSIEYKSDASPLTSADKEAHEIITQGLMESRLPVLSEEGKLLPYEIRKSWQLFWLVDPLDGTKEFISGNGEFTVNIALIENNSPIMGVVYLPVTGMLYFGSQEHGSYRVHITDKKENLYTNLHSIISASEKLPTHTNRPVTIIGSRSHQNEKTASLINSLIGKFESVDIVNAGSSLKFCRIAEGSADIYPRLGPTMEWDTAAGHAVCKFAGVKVLKYESDEELSYNKENLLNPYFIAVAEKYMTSLS